MPAKNYNEYMRDYMLRRYHERRATALTSLGGKCASCGSTENLELDHVDWRTKSLPLNKMWSVSKTRFDEELKKCQALCSECHLEKSRKDMSEIKRKV